MRVQQTQWNWEKVIQTEMVCELIQNVKVYLRQMMSTLVYKIWFSGYRFRDFILGFIYIFLPFSLFGNYSISYLQGGVLYSCMRNQFHAECTWICEYPRFSSSEFFLHWQISKQRFRMKSRQVFVHEATVFFNLCCLNTLEEKKQKRKIM